MEDNDGMYGMTGNSIASIFRDQAQIQQVNRRIAAEKLAKEDADALKKQQDIEKLGMVAYKGTSAYSTKQNRIAKSIVNDQIEGEEYLSEDASGFNPFKGGHKRIKLSKKFDKLDNAGKREYFQANPDVYKNLATKESLGGGGQMSTYNPNVNASDYHMKDIDQSTGEFTDPTREIFKTKNAYTDYKSGDWKERMMSAFRSDAKITPPSRDTLPSISVDDRMGDTDYLNSMDASDLPLAEGNPIPDLVPGKGLPFRSDDPGVKSQANSYKRYRSEGMSDVEAQSKLKLDRIESDPDYRQMYLDVEPGDPYIPNEEDMMMDELISSYGDNVEANADDIDSISDRYKGDVSGESMAEKAEEGSNILEDATDAAGEFQGTTAEYEDYLDNFFSGEDSGNLLTALPTTAVNAASTGGTLATLADSAGLINLDEGTRGGIEAAQTAKKAVDTAKAVQAGSITAASGMGKIMPAVGVVAGAMAAFNKNADTDDRVRGGLTAIGSAMMFTPAAPLGALLAVGSSLWTLLD